jgi:hypothetical protein
LEEETGDKEIREAIKSSASCFLKSQARSQTEKRKEKSFSVVELGGSEIEEKSSFMARKVSSLASFLSISSITIDNVTTLPKSGPDRVFTAVTPTVVQVYLRKCV